MKKQIFLMALAACILAACEKKNDTPQTEPESVNKETVLQKAMTPYVENTVIATYSQMADEGLVLLDKCETIAKAVENGTDYDKTLEEACAAWRSMRKCWEQSEAFLFGPAEKHNIDPHIDSWPLDYNAMNALLNNAQQMEQIEKEGGEYVGNKLGYALKGFHAAEYLLFENGKPHAANLTKAQAVYLLGIVEDLAQQAILLEDCWAGKVSEAKQKIITDDEGESMSYGEHWALYFINAGKAGSLYVTYQECAEQIIAGCVEIAGEVADLKLGNPYLSSNEAQREYIESPYSHTSTEDFKDNIISIRNAYQGAKEGDASISDYIQSEDSILDVSVRKTISTAIEKIEAIKNFESEAKGNANVKAAINAVAELEEILDKKVMATLGK